MERNPEPVYFEAICNKNDFRGITGEVVMDKQVANIAKIMVDACEEVNGKKSCNCLLKKLSKGEIPS